MKRLAVIAVVLLALPAGAARSVPAQPVRFDVFLHSGLPLGGIAWNGSGFLYSTETVGTLAVSDPLGHGLHTIGSLPNKVEEVRCELSPGTHGWPRGAVFCAWPGDRIYRVDPDGTVTRFADLPVENADLDRSDGAMVFDRTGRYGYTLLAATGHSSADPGGSVYEVAADGSVRLLGRYPGPGGADNLAMASGRFGRAAGDVLVAVDHDTTEGVLVAIDPGGRSFVVARHLGLGINPIVVVGGMNAVGGAAAGLYATDTISTNVYFAAGAQFRAYRGGVLAGVETDGTWYAITAHGTRFHVARLRTNLPTRKWNLEGAAWVGG
jgi:hypothetical protein